ncbi:hypothetical protein V5740_00705 [Croceibacterium sp. TMG7-5b_MA50]|jgi:hypothetical protein
MTPEEQQAIERTRRNRNRALGLALLAMVVLFYAITFVKFGAD